jgi:hypothetical protein
MMVPVQLSVLATCFSLHETGAPLCEHILFMSYLALARIAELQGRLTMSCVALDEAASDLADSQRTLSAQLVRLNQGPSFS